MLLILFFVNAAINTLFLHKSDSNEETGIIANRIKIIVPMLSVSVFTSSIMYCYCYCRYCGERLSALFIVALWITVYEIIISCIKCYDVKVKVIWCIISFMIFIIGMPMIINHYTDNSHFSQSSLNPLFDWFLIIGICIYLVGIKYFGYIARLLFKKQNAEKIISKIMSNTIWLRNSILGSMLFILVILVKTSKYFLVLGAIIFWALLMEYFVYQYAFNHSKRDNGETGGTVYTIGKIIEFLAVLSLLFSYMTESILNGQEGESPLKDYQNITLMVITVFAILVVMGLGLYIFSKLDKGQLVKLPELSQKQVLREVWNRLRSMKILTNDVLSDKNVVNFWMAVLTWGIYIVISVFSLYYYNSEFLNKMYGIILVAVIIEVDWIFLSRNIFNYYMEKMRESMNVMKYKKIFMEEWKECVAGLKGFKESDAKQFQCGSFLRPIMFYFGAAYQHQYNILQNDEAYRNIAKAACSIELIHKSTVLVDDYLDGDDIRNGAESFHYQYPDQRVLILLENSMQAKAQMNFMKSRRVFLCDNDVILDNMHKLSKIIYYINFGYYRELSLTDYEHLNIKEVDEINFLETGYFFKESIGLGYSCFHKFQSTSDYQNLEKLGKAFGYFYQCINDLEAFSRKERYERYKGKLNNLGKKNIVLLTLYNHLSEEEKGNFNNYKYREMAKLYRRYYIEQEVLEKVKKTLNEIKSILTLLEPGNKQWVKEFRILFNYFLADRRWENTFEL